MPEITNDDFRGEYYHLSSHTWPRQFTPNILERITKVEFGQHMMLEFTSRKYGRSRDPHLHNAIKQHEDCVMARILRENQERQRSRDHAPPRENILLDMEEPPQRHQSSSRKTRRDTQETSKFHKVNKRRAGN